MNTWRSKICVTKAIVISLASAIIIVACAVCHTQFQNLNISDRTTILDCIETGKHIRQACAINVSVHHAMTSHPWHQRLLLLSALVPEFSFQPAIQKKRGR